MCVEVLSACSHTVPSAWGLRNTVIAVEVMDPAPECMAVVCPLQLQ